MLDTIFAQATPPGRSAVAVIRVSGPGALDALAQLTPTPLPPRRASLRRLRHSDGTVLDEALVLACPGPTSFTGEDLVEIQCHGSRAVTAALLDLLAARPGLRLAEPGEFTRRALENGRLDLAQVEGLADLLAAETEAQRRQAMGLMQGGLSRLAGGWRTALVHALALVEVSIDFADEEIPDGVYLDAAAGLDPVVTAMARELAGAVVAERIRDGFEVALIGRPNVGKSSLLNALAGRSVAITSPVAGTTRDVIELRADLHGLPVTFLDTAGLRESDDPVEREGVARAEARAATADLRLVLDDGEDGKPLPLARDGDIIVQCKADIRSEIDGLAVSSVTGEGIDRLIAAIQSLLTERAKGATALSHERQHQAVGRARGLVERAREELLRSDPQVELVAADLQAALRALDFLVGRVDVDAILDVVFAQFCLGK